jgi:hypothetical protein
MEQTKKSTFKLLFYLKKNELKKNGNAPIMARITIDGTPKTFGTKLEINPNNWDLKYGRVEGKSAQALSINKKLDNIRGRIDKIYEDMLKHEGFATAQKVMFIIRHTSWLSSHCSSLKMGVYFCVAFSVISKSAFSSFFIPSNADFCIAITSIVCSIFLWKSNLYRLNAEVENVALFGFERQCLAFYVC